MAALEIVISRFRRLHVKSGSEEEFKMNANSLLDEFISKTHSLNDDRPAITTLSDDVLNSFITYGCKVLDKKNSLLQSKFASALHLILVKQKRILSQDLLAVTLPFLISCLNESPSSLKANFLQALGASLYGNGGNIEMELLEEILGPSSVLWSSLSATEHDFSIDVEAVQCLGSICTKSSSGNSNTIDKSFIKLAYQRIMDYLRRLLNFRDEENLELFLLVAKTLKVLQTVVMAITFQDGIVEADFAIALLRVFLVFGLPAFRSTVEHLIKNLPSARAAPSFDTGIFAKRTKSPLAKQVVKKKRKGKKSNSKKQLNFQDQDQSENRSSGYQSDQQNPVLDDSIFNVSASSSFVSSQSSSESEFSDSESSFRSRLRTTCCRIRQNALKCIQDVIKTSDRRSKLSSWLLLIPETMSDLEPSLVTCAMGDPSAKVRLSAIATLIELVNNSKQYLDAAVDRLQSQQAVARPFIPFSVKLNQSLVLLHEVFLEYFRERRPNYATEKALQCMSILVLNTPYEKIGSEFLHKLVMLLPKYLYAADLNITISSLTCLAAVLSVMPDNAEIKGIITSTPASLEAELVSSSNVRFGSWLVQYCFIELERDESDSAGHERIRNQCLQVLKIVVQFYPDLISSSERRRLLSLICERYIKMAECMLSFHSIKLLEEFGKCFSKKLAATHWTLQEELSHWKDILDGALIQLFQSQKAVAKILSAACDVLSTISAEAFEEMHIRYQIMYKTLLLGAANDEENSIKSAAVRALGILVTYPFVKEDDLFMVDVGEIIFRQLQSSSVNVRIKAGWSLGNFTDSLLRNKPCSVEEDSLDFSDDFIHSLLVACKNAAQDHDKVKPNGVRAIGNTLKWLPFTLSTKEKFKDVIGDAIEALTQNILNGPMKGRWNACYACGNMFQGSLDCLGETTWMENLFMALGTALKECKNFKVRISAGIALSTPKQRESYGKEELFSNIWICVVDALLSSEELSDFTEFRFKHNLQNKICMLICHMLSLATANDLQKMQPSIDKNLDIINQQVGKFLDDIAKEKDENDDQQDQEGLQRQEINIDGLLENLTKLQSSVDFESLRHIYTKLAAT